MNCFNRREFSRHPGTLDGSSKLHFPVALELVCLSPRLLEPTPFHNCICTDGLNLIFWLLIFRFNHGAYSVKTTLWILIFFSHPQLAVCYTIRILGSSVISNSFWSVWFLFSHSIMPTKPHLCLLLCIFMVSTHTAGPFCMFNTLVNTRHERTRL